MQGTYLHWLLILKKVDKIVVFSLYLVFFCYLLGIVFGFGIQWLWNNHHSKLVTFILVIIVGLLIVDGIMSVFNPDTLLRRIYSESQGWVDFVSGFAGSMLGFFLEDRYERNRKFKLIVHTPRQAPANPRAVNPKVFGFIKIVPEKYKERENEQFVMGGLPKYVLDLFLGMPHKEQALLANSTVQAVGELRLFQHMIANITSIPELIDELKGLSDIAVKYVKKERHGGYEDRFQLWLGEAKLSLIQVRLEELCKTRKNRTE